MKVIFLDIDGVLNTPETWSVGRTVEDRLDPDKLARVAALCAATGAQIVLSSVWRRLYSSAEMIDLFAARGFSTAPIVDSTPTIHHGHPLESTRGDEIREWFRLQMPAVVERFVILDDMGPENFRGYPELVQTNWRVGLTDEDCRRAEEFLQ